MCTWLVYSTKSIECLLCARHYSECWCIVMSQSDEFSTVAENEQQTHEYINIRKLQKHLTIPYLTESFTASTGTFLFNSEDLLICEPAPFIPIIRSEDKNNCHRSVKLLLTNTGEIICTTCLNFSVF